jgi:hypothetical protein
MSCRTPVLLTLTLAVLAGCNPGPQPMTTQARATAATRAACRASTERSFNEQNRYLLSERDTTDSPFSTSGVTGVTTRGLSQRYDYDTLLQNCLSSAGAGQANPTDLQPQPPTGTPVAPY